jgi:hypothetical protein
MGARAITGAFRTVSTAVAGAEASLQMVDKRHVQAGMRSYINIKTLPKTHPLATLKVLTSQRYMSPLKRLALAHKGSSIKRMEMIQAYIIPPWHNYILLVYKANREAMIIAAKDANNIMIITSTSNREGLVGIGSIIAYRSSGQIDKMVARYSVTLGP